MNQELKNKTTSRERDYGEVIFRYTRAEAIADGVLIDVTRTAQEAGLRYPVAITAAVWVDCVRVPEGLTGQDESGRLFDVVWMLAQAVRTARRDATELVYRLNVKRADDRTPELMRLKAVCGPDDNGVPCLTVMKLDED